MLSWFYTNVNFDIHTYLSWKRGADSLPIPIAVYAQHTFSPVKYSYCAFYRLLLSIWYPMHFLCNDIMESFLPNIFHHIGARFMKMNTVGNSALSNPKIISKIAWLHLRCVSSPFYGIETQFFYPDLALLGHIYLWNIFFCDYVQNHTNTTCIQLWVR